MTHVGKEYRFGAVGSFGLVACHGQFLGALPHQLLQMFTVFLQFIFGLLILPMVALYARSPHVRTQI